MKRMSSGTLVVPRAEFAMDDPWATPAACEPVRLRLATDGAAPRLSTSVCAYYDDDYLTVVFCAADDEVVATLVARDAPLYEEDVVEVFLAPVRATAYFELEVSPAGSIFDATIDSPDWNRATMTVDRAWDCRGLVAAVRKTFESDGAMSVDTVLRIPFAAVAETAPRSGARWLANFFRIDRSMAGDEFSAWQPTFKTPADFHVPRAFGTLEFV